jgi:SAM-dependent methyltransferase
MAHSTALSGSTPASAEAVHPLVEIAERARTEPPDYLERNKRTWDRWAAQYAVRGRDDWRATELRWGLWNISETELQLMRDAKPAADVIELGSGTSAVSGWLARKGFRPVAVDFSRNQLDTAARLQNEFGVSFPLVCANAESIPYDNECFDIAISEYGVSLWCDPRRWLPEAHRLLRAGGRLILFTNSAFLMACTPEIGGVATDVLVRSYFAPYRVEFPGEEAVEFHLTHGHWIRLLRETGFVLENLLEIRPPRHAQPKFDFVSLEWARRWPSEEIWIARKAS